MSRDYPVDVSDLDEEDISRIAHRTEQWARAALNAGQLTEAASLYTIAGSYYAHVRDVAGSAAALRSASRLHLELENPYAFALATAAADAEMSTAAVGGADVRGFVEAPVPPSADALAFRAPALGFLHASTPDSAVGGAAARAWSAVAESVGSRAATPTGRLNVPLALTIDVVHAAVAVTDIGVEAMPQLIRALRDYLHRADAMSSEARADEYHWRLLMSSVLPVEPEALAVTMAAVAAAELHTEVRWQLAELADLPGSARSLIFLAAQMLRSDGT